MPSVHENEVNDQAALIIQLYTLQWALYYENLVLIQANLLCLKIRCECNCGSDHNLPKVPKQNQNRKWLSISSVCSLLENQVHIGERDLHVFVLLCFLCMFQHNTQHGREGIPRFSITGNGAEKRGKEGRCSLSTGNYWHAEIGRGRILLWKWTRSVKPQGLGCHTKCKVWSLHHCSPVGWMDFQLPYLITEQDFPEPFLITSHSIIHHKLFPTIWISAN